MLNNFFIDEKKMGNVVLQKNAEYIMDRACEQ